MNFLEAFHDRKELKMSIFNMFNKELCCSSPISEKENVVTTQMQGMPLEMLTYAATQTCGLEDFLLTMDLSSESICPRSCSQTLNLFLQNSCEQMLTHSTSVWVPCALQSVSIELLIDFMFLFSSPTVEIAICGILGRHVQSVMMFGTFFAWVCCNETRLVFPCSRSKSAELPHPYLNFLSSRKTSEDTKGKRRKQRGLMMLQKNCHWTHETPKKSS